MRWLAFSGVVITIAFSSRATQTEQLFVFFAVETALSDCIVDLEFDKLAA